MPPAIPNTVGAISPDFGRLGAGVGDARAMNGVGVGAAVITGVGVGEGVTVPGTGVGLGVIEGVGVAQVHVESAVHDVFLQTLPEQTIDDGQSAFVEQDELHCGTGVGVGVAGVGLGDGEGDGVGVAQIQLVSELHAVFLQTPAVQLIPDGQSVSVVQDVPHCGTGVGLGLGDGVGVGVSIVKVNVQADGGTVAAAGLLVGAFGATDVFLVW